MDFLFFQNVQRLVKTQHLLSRLQDSLEQRENVGFQWLGPHLLSFFRYVKLNYPHNIPYSATICSYKTLLKHLDDEACNCLYQQTKHYYKKFLETILSLMPQIKELFTVQKSVDGTSALVTFLCFLIQSIGEILNHSWPSSFAFSNQVQVASTDLKFLLAFLGDITRQGKLKMIKNMLGDIHVVSNEVGLFLHSFFFTTEIVIESTMDLKLGVVLQSLKIVKEKIKDYYVSVSHKSNGGIGTLQVAKSSVESSTPVAEEIIVGLDDITKKITSMLLGGTNCRHIISIIGMGGLGKTTLTKKIYSNPNVRNYFYKHSWCVLSQSYKKRNMLIDILSSISNLDRDKISEMEDDKLALNVYQSLKHMKYIIVMDDIWDEKAWYDLNRLFPDDKNGSRVLLTSRLKNVASQISNVIIEPPPLSPSQCWELLQRKVFKNEGCPQKLQDVGKKIKENCDGLPLRLVAIASVLSNIDQNISSWEGLATNMNRYISDHCRSIVKLSYENLPSHLKPCFLYLTASDEDERIPIRKLLSLWIAEGFVEKKGG